MIEEAQAPQPLSTTLESNLAIANDSIKGFHKALEEQNRKIDQLTQVNTELRNELVNLSRTFQLSKRDLQRVENTIPKLTAELKTKFEKMLEKTEVRIQGPIDRLLEELGRMRASPPTPVLASGITTFPQNTQMQANPPTPIRPSGITTFPQNTQMQANSPTPIHTSFPPNAQFVPESQTEGEAGWAPQEGYNHPGSPNKQHYQENCEPLAQPVSSAPYPLRS